MGCLRAYVVIPEQNRRSRVVAIGGEAGGAVHQAGGEGAPRALRSPSVCQSSHIQHKQLVDCVCTHARSVNPRGVEAEGREQDDLPWNQQQRPETTSNLSKHT